MNEIHDICLKARAASRVLAGKTTAEKNAALLRIADRLGAESGAILAANAADVEAARGKGLAPAMIDRLTLNADRLAGVASAVREIAALPDPIGEVVTKVKRPNGLSVARVRVPLGVVAMVYESRPNVTVDASALTLKAGNAVVLRGGSEALRSNQALGAMVRAALSESGFPEDSVQVVPTTDRAAIVALVSETALVDLAIPRGGEALIKFVTENARVPVVQHYKGVCHLYVENGFDVASAVKIILDAKLARPSACNALECLLVEEAGAETLLPVVIDALGAGGAEMRVCDRTLEIAGNKPSVIPARESDYGQEFLAPVIAIKVVRDLDAAIAHIEKYGSGHTEGILTNDHAHAARFQNAVDAACVVVNTSTRFHDGGELGLGAEIGIATSKLHWRGPMGLESLTTMKWVVEGQGQIRA